ncbi:MAG: helix-turn-helix transcriptional regulator [Pirellulales bacterium]
MSPAPKPPDQDSYSGRFAARLKSLREKAGLSVPQITEALRSNKYTLGDRTYYQWESGRSMPPIDAFPALAMALNLKSPRLLLPQS